MTFIIVHPRKMGNLLGVRNVGQMFARPTMLRIRLRHERRLVSTTMLIRRIVICGRRTNSNLILFLNLENNLDIAFEWHSIELIRIRLLAL
jgi:hypothetical protein